LVPGIACKISKNWQRLLIKFQSVINLILRSEPSKIGVYFPTTVSSLQLVLAF
jgi:hypothetical protein